MPASVPGGLQGKQLRHSMLGNSAQGLVRNALLPRCAGRADGVIARENVVKHYNAMRAAGCDVTYKEFESFGHLDFTFAVKDDLRHYVLSRLLMRR